jgi:hypothetical protein
MSPSLIYQYNFEVYYSQIQFATIHRDVTATNSKNEGESKSFRTESITK